jgi:hypothetical protein
MGMSAKNNRTPSITEPILSELVARDQAIQKTLRELEAGTSVPKPSAAELDQDPGGGYNPNHTLPQP